jgi:hypothetical protein
MSPTTSMEKELVKIHIPLSDWARPVLEDMFLLERFKFIERIRNGFFDRVLRGLFVDEWTGVEFVVEYIEESAMEENGLMAATSYFDPLYKVQGADYLGIKITAYEDPDTCDRLNGRIEPVVSEIKGAIREYLNLWSLN